MIKNIEKGQDVWFNDVFDKDVNSGTVLSIGTGLANGLLHIKRKQNASGSLFVQIENCYPTKEALVSAMKEKRESRIHEVCECILDVESLVSLMYGKMVDYAEQADSVDWAAIQAMSIRAKELLGLDLPYEE